MKITLYVRDQHVPTWEDARLAAQAAGESLSQFLAAALREYLAIRSDPAVRAAELRRRAAELRAGAVANEASAARAEEVFSATGRETALRSAEIHRAEASRKRARAEELEAQARALQ